MVKVQKITSWNLSSHAKSSHHILEVGDARLVRDSLQIWGTGGTVKTTSILQKAWTSNEHWQSLPPWVGLHMLVKHRRNSFGVSGWHAIKWNLSSANGRAMEEQNNAHCFACSNEHFDFQKCPASFVLLFFPYLLGIQWKNMLWAG